MERLSLLLGGALSPQLTSALMGQVTNEGESVEVSEAMRELLAEVGEVIIPTTDTPGAKDAEAHEFAIRVLRDCHVKKEQEQFYRGLEGIDKEAQKVHGKGFVALSPEEKEGVVDAISRSDKNFFRQLKQFIVTGYFISEVGAVQTLEYLPIPGRFEGDVPMEPGQKAWAISR